MISPQLYWVKDSFSLSTISFENLPLYDFFTNTTFRPLNILFGHLSKKAFHLEFTFTVLFKITKTIVNDIVHYRFWHLFDLQQSRNQAN